MTTNNLIDMNLSMTVPTYKPYQDQHDNHHAHNQIYTPSSFKQAEGLRRVTQMFLPPPGGEYTMKAHTRLNPNGMVELNLPSISAGLSTAVDDINGAMDMFRVNCMMAGFHVGNDSNLPNSDPAKFKYETLLQSPKNKQLVEFLQQQGEEGYAGLERMYMHGRTNITLSTIDPLVADKLLKTTTAIYPALAVIYNNESLFFKGEKQDKPRGLLLTDVYNDAFDNSGNALQRSGLITDVINSDYPFETYKSHEFNLEANHSLHPNTKLSELRKIKNPGRSFVKNKETGVHLFFPDVEAAYDFNSGHYSVTLHLDYQPLPGEILSKVHELIGTEDNLNDTMTILNRMDLPVTGPKAEKTAQFIQEARQNIQDKAYQAPAGSHTVGGMITLLFNENNRQALLNQPEGTTYDLDSGPQEGYAIDIQNKTIEGLYARTEQNNHNYLNQKFSHFLPFL